MFVKDTCVCVCLCVSVSVCVYVCVRGCTRVDMFSCMNKICVHGCMCVFCVCSIPLIVFLFLSPLFSGCHVGLGLSLRIGLGVLRSDMYMSLEPLVGLCLLSISCLPVHSVKIFTPLESPCLK